MSRLTGDVEVTGNLTAGSMTLSSGSVTNSNVAAGAAISATKVVSLHKATTDFGLSSEDAPAAVDKVIIYRAHGSATLRRVSAQLLNTGSTTTSNVFNVYRVPAGSTSETTVLNAALTVTDSDTNNTAQTGSLAITSLAAGDILVAEMVFGSAGTGAVGPLLTVEVDEAAT